MKTIKIILSFCIILMAGFSSEVLASNDKVIIATSGDYAPANVSDAQCAKAVGITVKTNNNHLVCGFEIDLMSKVCEVRHLDCEWTLEPFAWSEQDPNFPGILSNLFSKSPKYDLVLAYLRGNKERIEKLNASGSYIEGHPTFYKSSLLVSKSVRKNSKGYPFSKKLNGKSGNKIKIAASGIYASDIVNAEFGYYSAKELKTIEVVPVESLEDQISLLSSGDVDFVYGPNISSAEFVSKNHLAFAEVPQLEKSIEVGSRVFATKDARGEFLVDEINKGLLDLYRSGEYQKIFDKYLIYDSWGKQNGPK